MHGAPVVSSVYGKVDAVVSAGYTGQGGDSCCDVYFHCCITHHAFPHARTHPHTLTHTHTHTYTHTHTEAGNAIYDVLTGEYNPAGRLAVTWYTGNEQLPPMVDYTMVNRTYRYMAATPQYYFGYGLSYTTFQYSSLSVSSNCAHENQIHSRVY